MWRLRSATVGQRSGGVVSSRGGCVDLVVGGGGQLTDTSFGQHLRRPAVGAGGVVVDLRDAVFVDCLGLVTIAAAVQRAVFDGQTVDFVPPVDPQCSRWLSRMGLRAQLQTAGVDSHLPVVRAHPSRDRLLELQAFGDGGGADGSAAADELAEQVFRLFSDDDQELSKALYRAVIEVADNVLGHSERTVGFVALQVYPTLGEVAFAISDSGVGLAATLAAVTHVVDDGHAVSLAAQRHVSRTRQIGRGRGLPSVVDAACATGGRVTLWSGAASGIFTTVDGPPRLHRHPAGLAGTVVNARVRRR